MTHLQLKFVRDDLEKLLSDFEVIKSHVGVLAPSADSLTGLQPRTVVAPGSGVGHAKRVLAHVLSTWVARLEE